MRHSIAWQIILPIPVVTLLALLLAWLLLPSLIAQHAVDGAVQSAQSTVRQFKTLRAYYTKFVVAKVVKQGGSSPISTTRPTKQRFPCRRRWSSISGSF
jgi:methyl-accepting chemotaxis protein